MRTFMLAGATALAFATVPATIAAQDSAAQAGPVTSDGKPVVAAPSTATAPAPRTTAEANAKATTLPSTTEVIPGARPGDPDTVVTTHHGNLTPPPVAALNRTYPLCTRTLQDSCRNPGEGEDEAALGG